MSQKQTPSGPLVRIETIILKSRGGGNLAGTFEVRTFEESRGVEMNAPTRSHEALVYSPSAAGMRWAPSQLAPGQKLGEPKALFKKLDESVIEKEVGKLGKS